MIKRVAATVAASVILWFLWWILAWILLALLASATNFDLAMTVVGSVFWVVVVAIPALVWFLFRHVQ